MKTLRYKSRQGFTLLELLAVMAIMLILSGMAITGYRAMLSGSGTGASIGHLRQSLDLARQTAIMQGKSAFLVFSQDASNSWYLTCMGEGYATVVSGATIQDTDNPLSTDIRKGMELYNLNRDGGVYATVLNVDSSTGTNAYTLSSAIFSVDDRYGWQTAQKIKLPRGFRFSDNPPKTVRFKPDGTAADVNGAQTTFDVRMFEESRPDKIYTVTVKGDGRITTVMP